MQDFKEEKMMMDLIYIGLAVVFFAISAAYVQGCNKL